MTMTPTSATKPARAAMPGAAKPRRVGPPEPGECGQLMVEQLFDCLATRVNDPCCAKRLTVDWNFTDLHQHHRMIMCQGSLLHWPTGGAAGGADLTVVMTNSQLQGVLAGNGPGGVGAVGDPDARHLLLDLLEAPPSPPPQLVDHAG